LKSIHTKAYSFLVGRLKQARKQAGLSQQDLADRLGRPQSFVAKYESAERRLDVLEYVGIAFALDLDPCAPIGEVVPLLEASIKRHSQRSKR
jgi:transcriptional regulator with XRE-family HTH domain